MNSFTKKSVRINANHNVVFTYASDKKTVHVRDVQTIHINKLPLVKREDVRCYEYRNVNNATEFEHVIDAHVLNL